MQLLFKNWGERWTLNFLKLTIDIKATSIKLIDFLYSNKEKFKLKFKKQVYLQWHQKPSITRNKFHKGM